MPPRAVKKSAGTPTPKKAAAKTPNKTPKSAKKTPPPKVKPEIVENVQKLEEAAPVEDVEVLEVPVKEEKSIEAGKLKERSAKDGAVAEKPAPLNESAPKNDDEKEAKPSFDEDDKGERLELDENVSESQSEEDDEGPKDDAAAMDVDQDFVAQEDEEEGSEDQLDEGEHEGDEGIGEEEEGEGEEMEGEGKEEEVGEEQESEEEDDEQQVAKERRKRKEFEVFVGGLDKDASEEDLRKVFSEVGEVVEIRLMMNAQTQKNKGFAFIRYATVEQAKRACTELKNPQVNGKVCGISPSQDNDTLFLGNICKTWTKEALREKLKSFSIDNIEDLTLVEDPENEGMNRGIAFIEFSARSDAMNAYKRLQKRDVVLGTDRTAKVSFAETFVDPDEEVMAQVKTVFVDGLPPSWDEDRIREQFKKYGDIDKIQLARNMPSARRRDFGFVTFSAHDAAVACIDGLNNIGLGEGDNKVKVKARLSKPHQKGRLLKHGVRGGYIVGRGRGSTRGGRGPWVRAPAHFEPRRFGARGGRFIGRGGQIGGRGVKRPLGRNAYPPVSERFPSRHLPPFERVRDRRPPAPAYPRNNSRRDYGRRDELYDDRHVRSSRSAPDFATRAAAARRSSYRDGYANRGSSSYSDNAPPRGVSRTASRRPPYSEESYGRRMDKPYRDSRGRDYDNVSGSKRPYSAVEEPPRYAEPAIRNSRARLDYGVSASASQYGDYGESTRLGRGSQLDYGGSARQDSYGLYDGHQSSVGYGGSKTYSSLGGSEAAGTYSSYANDYLSSGADIGGGSYSSLYSSRSMGSGYLPGSGSGSYY